MSIEQEDIVLIEDNQYDVELILRALDKLNLKYNFVILEDGEKALDYFFGRGIYKDRNTFINPKLILLDLKLPKLNGIDVLHEIKSNNKTKQIPVVVLTSSNEEKDIIESYKLGVNSYVVKPVDFNEFIETVKSIGIYWVELNEIQ
jgi:CheY-like chemotaxis protein